MKINRDELLRNLLSFSQNGHGVIIGNPGVGKSYMLKLLKKKHSEKNVISFIVKIDNTENASDEAIAQEIGLDKNRNWIETLKNITISEFKAVLIFDAFDAARDESIRKAYLSQIRKAKRELSEKWNILVSVRTYDASKSEDLLQLFPEEGLKDTVRKFLIPLLTENELRNAVGQSLAVESLYNQCTIQLKEIIRTPYFLKLLENILVEVTPEELETIKIIKSETQLLNQYWSQKVDSNPRGVLKEKFLLSFTNELVESRSLSLSRNRLHQLFPEGDQLIEFEYFKSEDILSEGSTYKSRIFYSHNILFDYAVSRLCLSDNVTELLEFITKDLSRPFFLRPSFIYFFTQVWYDNPNEFWKIYWKLASESRKEIQLFVKLILNTVIAEEYNRIEDLNNLFSDSKSSPDAIHQALQSIRFVREGHLNPIDIELLLYVSDKLKFEYLWSYSVLLETAINSTDPLSPDFKKCGIAARNFFGFILDNKSYENVDRLGSIRGIDLITKTYGTNKEDSKGLLEVVLNFLSVKDFEIWYFTSLTENVKYIIDHDVDFVVTIYKRLFGHIENSDSETTMGRTSTMNFRSNRRQDFDLCLYRLVRFYPTFLNRSPQRAIEVAVLIINDYVIEDQLYRYGQEKEKYSFKIRDISCEFISDASSIWKDNFDYNKAGEIARELFKYLEEIVQKEENYQAVKDIFSIYIKHSKVAFLWKGFIELATKYPKLFKDDLLALSKVEVILESTDTTYEIGEAIEQLIPFLSPKEISEIEVAIFTIYDSSFKQLGFIEIPKEELKKYRDKIVSKLLNKISEKFLQNEESKQFVNEHAKVPNKPPYEFSSSSEPYTPEMWFQDEGIDISKKDNATVIEEFKVLDSFNHRWLNHTPTREHYLEHLEKAKQLLNRLSDTKDAIDPKIVDSAMNSIARTLSIISRNAVSLSNEEFLFVKKAILLCFGFITEHDKTFDLTQSPARGYSSTPRIDAAEALIYLLVSDSDDSLLETVKKAITDSNPIVRFNAIKHISRIKMKYEDAYWELLYLRLEAETDYFTSGVIINNIVVNDKSLEKVDTAISIADNKTGFFDSNNSFTESFAMLLIWLYAEKHDVKAKRILEARMFNFSFCRTVIIKAFDHIDPSTNDYSSNIGLNSLLFEYIKDVIDKYGHQLKSFAKEDFAKDNEHVKHSLEIMDHIVQRTYFALDLNEGIRRREKPPVSDEGRKAFYFIIKPFLEKVIAISSEISAGGIILAHTAHYFMEILNGVVNYDPKGALSMANLVTKLSVSTQYTFDSSSIKEVVGLTEKLLADHRDLLTDPVTFNQLIELLEIYINSGWPDALELLWKLDEVFK